MLTAKLWPHQAAARDFALSGTLHPGCAGLWLDMRTGKTLTALSVAAELEPKRVLVVAPRVPAPGWLAQIQEHTENFPAPILLVDGPVKRRVERLRDHWREHDGRITAIVNYECALAEAFREPLLKGGWEMLIADEAHRLKGGTTKIGKLWRGKLRDTARWRLLLSGTPTPQGYADYFGVYASISPRAVVEPHWTAFSRRFAIRANPRVPQMVTGWRQTDVLDDLPKRWSVSVREEDCWPVDEPAEEWLWADLWPSTRKLYDDFARDLTVRVADDDMTAANALVLAVRLQQLAGGVAVTGEGEAAIQRRVSREKLDLLRDWLEDRLEPVVVFAQFVADLDGIEQAARSLKRPALRISAGRNDEEAWHRACAEGKNPIIACQLQAGSEGIDLSEARLCVFLATGYASARYAQARARVRGHRQKRRVHYVHVGAAGTIDETIREALQRKRSFERAVLDAIGLKRRAQDGE